MAGTVTAWMNELKAGNFEACERLWDYFVPDILKKIAPDCRNLKTFDEEDIVLVAFYNLTTAMTQCKVDSVTNRKEFWRLLKTITKRRLSDLIRYERAEKRGGEDRVVSIAQTPESFEVVDTIDHRSDCCGELLSKLLEVADGMNRPEFRTIIELKVSGMTNAEVARKLGMSLRTIQYLINDIKKKWLASFN